MLLLFRGVLLTIVLVLLYLDLVELLGICLCGLPHPVARRRAAAEVDGRRHGLEVEGRLKPRKVGKDAASGEDEEIATLPHDAFVEALRGLFKLSEESLKEERVPGLVVVPLQARGGT